MLVQYKNLENGKLTEERDVFIDTMYKEFKEECPKRFIYSIVKCFENAIMQENRDGITDRRDKGIKDAGNKQYVKGTVKNFFDEIDKALEDKKNIPSINKNINLTIDKNDLWGRNLNFLLTLPMEDTDYLCLFEKYYETKIPTNHPDKEFIPMVIRTVLKNMKEATLRGLNGEKNQTDKERLAEKKWNQACSVELNKKHQSSTSGAEEPQEGRAKRVRFSI